MIYWLILRLLEELDYFEDLAGSLLHPKKSKILEGEGSDSSNFSYLWFQLAPSAITI